MTGQATKTQWWLATIGNTLIWARLQHFADEHAEVLGADGELRQFASDEGARAVLLDAEFRALDGLDEDDANALGFDLAGIVPPAADSDAELVSRMTATLTGHA